MPKGYHKANSDKAPIVNKRNLPYSLDNGIGHRARIGVIALPDDLTIEHELRMIFDLPGVACYVNRLPCAPNITPQTLKAMQSEIARSAGLILPELSLDVMALRLHVGLPVHRTRNGPCVDSQSTPPHRLNHAYRSGNSGA